ncbi:uncharacterized protein Gasu_10710 [Galdieria sulphuraria]|uniref:Uncharacterized protein n=1 Tax=Galdieria sulphuraria TaxID=130081 RepID=M2XNC5_GALSU|nr:uncharacterized protein Gasu_10710 [Galdieria sulphuraria]EME31692.1 hypothetical protein Gasu_10710 [Galdieria sulphuraria]|eukprot:XP_005708212.1 hypothetical protein Gasu_10710 [Galdieria sulphuraria]
MTRECCLSTNDMLSSLRLKKVLALLYILLCIYHLCLNDLEFTKTPCLKLFSLSGYILQRILSLELHSNIDMMEHSAYHRYNTYREPLIMVIPFTSGQIERVLHMLSLFERVPPCRPQGRPVRHLPTVLFYYHASLETHFGKWIQQNISQVWNALPISIRDCFSYDILWKSANLTGIRDLYSKWDSEAYSAGTNNMFYGIMRDCSITRKYQYMFYCEPDVSPIRSGWLDKLVELSLLSDQHKVWMIGSVYMGHDFGAVISWALQYTRTAWKHLNGNALYRLGDASFLRYLYYVEKKYYPFSFDMIC